MICFKQYDCVKVVELKKNTIFAPDSFNRRPPQIGDIATIVEIYTNPEGYELECCNNAGITEWLCTFAPQDIKLELIDT